MESQGSGRCNRVPTNMGQLLLTASSGKQLLLLKLRWMRFKFKLFDSLTLTVTPDVGLLASFIVVRMVACC